MFNFQHTGILHAAPDKVFAVISDPRRIPEWRKDVPGIGKINGSGTGMTFVEEVHFMGRKELLMKVTEHVPGSRLVIEAQGGMKLLPTQTFELAPEGQGTRLRLSVMMRTSGFFRLMEPMLPGKLKKIWVSYFEELDRLVAR
ncbi:MAG TPA: SRPBCC family protein [Flavobacteriales bacterium]|nr:SRPBCC family protein [Flavobacteriales bacterium]